MKFLNLAVAAGLTIGDLSATPISFVDMFRSATFSQTSNAPPGSPTGYFFSADVNIQNAGDFTGATFTRPVGGPQTMSILGLFNPLAF